MQTPNISGSKAPKRSRSENWAEQDKMILIELIKKKVHIIENKNTDHNTNSKKTEAWKDLRDSFNTMSIATRSTTQLKAQWCLMKMNEKKRKYSERKERFKTGGGPPPASEPMKGEDISTWLPQEFHVDGNQFDSDNQIGVEIDMNPPQHTSYDTPTINEDIVIEEVIQIAETEVIGNNDEISVKADEILRNKKQIKQKKVKKCSDGSKFLMNKVAKTEINCRRKLHKAQLANEEQKFKNLQLEERVLQSMLQFYNKN